MKKILSIIISVILIIANFLLSFETAFAKSDDIIEFPCGIRATAYLDRTTGTLTVKGSGEMQFFQNSVPWWAYRNEIYHIVIEEGITSLAAAAFAACDIKKIKLPSSLETIEIDALSMTCLEEIEVPSDSKLCNLELDSYFRDLPWYKAQPDGPVYLGNMLLEYKGTMPANTSVTVKNGTYAINGSAFYNRSGLTNVTVPDSVERIGKQAFYATSWMDKQPYYQPVYLGKVLYYYNFPWRAIKESDITEKLVIREGTVSISADAFNSHCTFRNIVLPESLEHIGRESFFSCNHLENLIIPQNSNLKTIEEDAFIYCHTLKDFVLPEGFESLGTNAFLYCKSLENINLPSSFNNIGLVVFEPNTLKSFSVDNNNPYFSTDNNGVLYNKNKTEVYASYQSIPEDVLSLPETVEKIDVKAFVSSPIKEFVLPESVKEIGFSAFAESSVETINIPYGIKRIESQTFDDCSELKEITIPKTVEFIDSLAFDSCTGMRKIIIPSEVKYIAGDALDDYDSLTLFCYKNTAAYYYATENNIPYVILEHPDTAKLNALIEEHRNLDRKKYFEESLTPLDNAVSSVDMTITVITQEMVDNWIKKIEEAKNQLRYLPADYSEIDAAIARVEAVDRSLYTAESLAALDRAVSSVDNSLDVSNQSKITEYAEAIDTAIKNLEYLPADYKNVSEAIAQSKKIDRILYSQASLAVLDQSIAAVDYTLNITQQNIVEGFADRIFFAASSLEYADVILRNEPNGVIVSATAKEIYPTTALTVDMLDPSNYETANFAVGGHIKSVQYYDINLFMNGEKIQPDGTVFVKIRIPDNVIPEKCRVYHVTDDPVDPLVRFSNTLDGNYIVFETNHFSEFAVIEVETYLSGISITKMPSVMNYRLNEKLDISDMEVTALFSDGKTQTITDYDVSSVDTSSIGTKIVSVYYTFGDTTKSASFEITVSADTVNANITLNGESINEYNKKICLFKRYSRESVKLDCAVPDNYRIEWISDNPKVAVDSNGKVTNKGLFFARKATITVRITDSAGNVLATDSITVRFYKLSFQLSGIQSTVIQTLKKFRLTF